MSFTREDLAHDAVKTCSIDVCDRQHYGLGLCEAHYARARRGSDISTPIATLARPFEERFWEKVDQRDPDECWPWTGARSKGYGAIKDPQYSKNRYAHRISYEMHHGPIPNGMEVMHRCDNPPCVNPAHLSVGTHAENQHDKAIKGRSGNRWAQR